MMDEAELADMQRDLQGEIESAMARIIHGLAGEADHRFICGQCGVDYDRILRQEKVNERRYARAFASVPG